MSEFEDFDWGVTYDSASIEVLPVGEYQVECFEANATTSSNGNPMIKVKYRLIDGPFAGRTLFDQHTLSVSNQTALSMFFRRMKAFGLVEAFFKSLPKGDMGSVANALVGRRVIVKVIHDTWNDETREKVTGIRPPVGGQTPVTSAPTHPQQSTPSIFGMPTSGVPSIPTQTPLSMPNIPAIPTAVPAPVSPQSPEQAVSPAQADPASGNAPDLPI
jgi:hypothetical protein